MTFGGAGEIQTHRIAKLATFHSCELSSLSFYLIFLDYFVLW